MEQLRELYCEGCNQGIPESKFIAKCSFCGGPLRVRYPFEIMKRVLLDLSLPLNAGSFLHQWKGILPIDNEKLIDRISLGEQVSPLVPSSKIGPQAGIKDLRFKLEFLSPTLSLKDRGTSLCTLKALEWGYDTLCIASSGNNAASVAAYAAKAGLQAVVFIQKEVSPAKVQKIISYGARVVRVDGDMSAASKVSQEMAETHSWFPSGGENPYRFTAKRTVAYEIFYQLGKRAPDAIVFPIGSATGFVSAYEGFKELLQMGLIGSMPRFIGIQLQACDPVTQAFDAGEEKIRPVVKKPSISDALMNNTPFWGNQALRAVRETGGQMISVADEELVESIRSMASQEGFFLEPAGVASIAGLRKLLKEKKMPPCPTVVCMITGHGLNAPDVAVHPREVPEVVPPEISAVEAYLKIK